MLKSSLRTLSMTTAVTMGLSGFNVACVVAQSPNDLQETGSAVAKANKSVSIEPGYSSVQPAGYNELAQNDAVNKPQPPVRPSVQPAPNRPPSTIEPAPPATTVEPDRPKATPPVSTPSTGAADSSTTTPALSPFAAFEPPSRNNPFLARLSRTPDVFGDSFNPVSAAIFLNNLIVSSPLDQVVTDLPLGGGMRRFKNEHARALPTDRVFFLYNHFHNALRFETDNTSVTDNVDQFTFGFEKTSDDGQWSFELRMPFSGDVDLAGDDAAVESNGVGNLVGTLKRLLYSDSNFAAALGLAVVAPTGSDATVTFSFAGQSARTEFKNDAVHLLPYLALQMAPDDNWFFHTFVQVDIAANENKVNLQGPGFSDSGSLADQTLLYLDASAGYWWYRTTNDSGLTGLASVVELHYTTTLNDADTANLNGAFIGNFENRYDVLNLTAGVHSEWSGNTAVRVAVVVPLDRDERFFDSETQVSVIRRY
tara:strand:+ start:100110 stop:101549 length:1440 start_codon:yes stop_codon:yes gene_type:complete